MQIGDILRLCFVASLIIGLIIWIVVVYIKRIKSASSKENYWDPIGYVVKKKSGPGKMKYLLVGPSHGEGYTAWYCDIDKREVSEMYVGGMHAEPNDFEIVKVDPAILYDIRYNYLSKFKIEILYTVDSFNFLYGDSNGDHNYNDRTFSSIKKCIKNYLYIEELMNQEKA